MDLDLWDCFGRKKLCLITEEIQYDGFPVSQIVVVATCKHLFKTEQWNQLINSCKGFVIQQYVLLYLNSGKMCFSTSKNLLK